MKIYNKIVWEWDESKKELVEIESDSYEYEGPLVKADPATIAVTGLILQGVGLLSSMKGQQDAAAAKEKLGKGRAANVLSENKLKTTILTKNARKQVFDILNQGQWQEEQYVKDSEKLIARNIAKYSGTKKTVEGLETQTFTNAYVAMMDMKLGQQAIKFNTANAISQVEDSLKDQITLSNTYAQNASWEYSHGAETARTIGNINTLTTFMKDGGQFALNWATAGKEFGWGPDTNSSESKEQ